MPYVTETELYLHGWKFFFQGNRKVGGIQASMDLLCHLTLHMQTKSISAEFLELLKGQWNISKETHFLEWFAAMCISL